MRPAGQQFFTTHNNNSSSINWDFPDEFSLTTVASSSHEFTSLRRFDKAIPSAPGSWPSRQMAANQAVTQDCRGKCFAV